MEANDIWAKVFPSSQPVYLCSTRKEKLLTTFLERTFSEQFETFFSINCITVNSKNL